MSELSYWATAHGVFLLPEYSRLKLLSRMTISIIIPYFTSLIWLFLGLLVTFWKLVFGENIFVLHGLEISMSSISTTIIAYTGITEKTHPYIYFTETALLASKDASSPLANPTILCVLLYCHPYLLSQVYFSKLISQIGTIL